LPAAGSRRRRGGSGSALARARTSMLPTPGSTRERTVTRALKSRRTLSAIRRETPPRASDWARRGAPPRRARGQLALGDVHHDAVESPRVARLVAKHAHAVAHPDQPPVRGDHPGLELVARPPPPRAPAPPP